MTAATAAPPRPAAAPPPENAAPRCWGPGAWTALGGAAALAFVVPLVVLGGFAPALRPLLCVAFVLTVPGVPLALALRLPDGPVTATLAIAISPATTMLAASVAVVADAWNPTGVLLVIADLGLAVSAVAAVRELRARRRARLPATTAPDPWDPRAWWPVLRPALAGPDPRLRAGAVVVLTAAGALWWSATRTLDVTGADPVGLVAMLPWTYWVALAAAAAAAGTALTRPRLDHPVVGSAVAALVVITFGVVNVADGAGSVGAGWVQVGFAEVIARTGDTVTGVDARFSWPGFLAGVAQLTTWAGLPDAGPLLILAPVAFELLVAAPVWVIGRTVTGSGRLAWVGVLIYLMFAWYQQDYFSAQAVATVLGLAVLATMLWAADTAPAPEGIPDERPWWRRALDAPRRMPARPAEVSGPTAVALDAVLLAVLVAVVLGHQLTPMVLLASLVWFVLAGATRSRTLWAATFVVFVAWFSYGATDYWTGHLATVLGDVGQVGSVVTQGVGDRIAGDHVYQAMQLVRTGWTALLGVLAVVGWWFVRRRRHAVLVLGLAAAPATLVLAQSYGGEVIIRCALYASPFLAPLAAVAVGRAAGLLRGRAGRLPWPGPSSRRPWVRPVAAAAVLTLGLATGFGMLTTTRGVNVSFEHVSAAEVDAARYVLTHATPGQTVASLSAVGPLPLGGVGTVTSEGLVDRDDCGATASAYADCVRAVLGPTGRDGPDWIYATDGMEAEGVLQGGQEAGWSAAGLSVLRTEGHYRTVVARDDVVVLEKADPPTTSPAPEPPRLPGAPRPTIQPPTIPGRTQR